MTQLADKTSLGELLGLAYRARVSHVHDRVLLLAMVFHADWNSGRNIYASLTTLAHECALSVSAVQRSLRRLLPDGGLGYVVVQAPPTSRRPVTYRLDIPALERGRSAQPKGPGARGRRLLRMSLAASRPDTLGVSIGPPRVVPQTTQGGLPDHSRVVCGTTDPSLYPSHDPSLARVQITRDRRTNAQTRLQTVAAVQMTKGKERADEGGGCSPSQLERARVSVSEHRHRDGW